MAYFYELDIGDYQLFIDVLQDFGMVVDLICYVLLFSKWNFYRLVCWANYCLQDTSDIFEMLDITMCWPLGHLGTCLFIVELQFSVF